MAQQKGKREILVLLTLIDSKLESSSILVTMGGTALALLNSKEFSYDFILVSSENPAEFYKVYYETIKQLGWHEEEHPVWDTFNIGFLKIDDYFKRAKEVKQYSFKHIHHGYIRHNFQQKF